MDDSLDLPDKYHKYGNINNSEEKEKYHYELDK